MKVLATCLCMQRRINHSGAPYQCNAGSFFHMRSQDFLWGCFSMDAIFFPQKVDDVFYTFKPTLNIQTSKQLRKNLAVDQGPPPMVQLAQWLIQPCMHASYFIMKQLSFDLYVEIYSLLVIYCEPNLCCI